MMKSVFKMKFAFKMMKYAENTAAAVDLYNQFKSDEIDGELEGVDFDGMSKKEKKKAKAARKQERKAYADLIDYREWVVAMSAICMKGSKEKRISFIFGLFDKDSSGTIDRDEFAELVSGTFHNQPAVLAARCLLLAVFAPCCSLLAASSLRLAACCQLLVAHC